MLSKDLSSLFVTFCRFSSNYKTLQDNSFFDEITDDPINFCKPPRDYFLLLTLNFDAIFVQLSCVISSALTALWNTRDALLIAGNLPRNFMGFYLALYEFLVPVRDGKLSSAPLPRKTLKQPRRRRELVCKSERTRVFAVRISRYWVILESRGLREIYLKRSTHCANQY